MDGPEVNAPPAVVAAKRARADGDVPASGTHRQRAYPRLELAQDLEALSAVLAATRALLRTTSPKQVADVVATLVHDLGGGLVPARLADGGAVQVDVSFGLSEPLLPWAEPVSLAAMRLTAELPCFVEDARLVLHRLRTAQELETGPREA